MKILGNINYADDDNIFHCGDMYLPDDDDAFPLVLSIHGGGWTTTDKSAMNGVCAFRGEQEMEVYNIDYILSLDKPWPACGDDGLLAANFLLSGSLPLEYAQNTRAISIVGASAGGHLALMTGLRLPREKVDAMISISGICSPEPDIDMNPSRHRALFGHTPNKKEQESASPTGLLNRNSPPVFCSHCIHDGIVPAEASRELVRVAEQYDIPVESYFYDRKGEGHSIWIPSSKPHRLYPDLANGISLNFKKYDKFHFFETNVETIPQIQDNNEQ